MTEPAVKLLNIHAHMFLRTKLGGGGDIGNYSITQLR